MVMAVALCGATASDVVKSERWKARRGLTVYVEKTEEMETRRRCGRKGREKATRDNGQKGDGINCRQS